MNTILCILIGRFGPLSRRHDATPTPGDLTGIAGLRRASHVFGEVCVGLAKAIVCVVQGGDVLLLGRDHRVLLTLHGEQPATQNSALK